jgi:prepilin-type N-terminal cleavage/methylation domain-containing protein
MKGQKGFTLVEIAIVLVVIGLLIGGILKGRTFIDNAKIKNVIKQSEGLTAAIYAYQDRYGLLPGDDSNANARWGSATNGNANGQIAGGESPDVFQHLALAEFITGEYDGTNYMNHKYGADVRVINYTLFGKTGNTIRFQNLPAQTAAAFDSALDDGIYNTGSVRGNEDYNSNPEEIIGWTAYFF